MRVQAFRTNLLLMLRRKRELGKCGNLRRNITVLTLLKTTMYTAVPAAFTTIARFSENKTLIPIFNVDYFNFYFILKLL